MNKTSAQRRSEIILSHIRDVRGHVTKKITNECQGDIVEHAMVEEVRSTRPNIFPVSLVSQINALTTKSFDLYRTELFGTQQKNDLVEIVYTLSQLTHHITFFLSRHKNVIHLKGMGLKNSNYAASVLIVVANCIMAIVKHFKLFANHELQKIFVVILNIITHVCSGLLQRNALVIIQNASPTNRQQRLMTALYVLLTSASPLFIVGPQSYMITRFGLPFTLSVVSIIILIALPLFKFEDVREIYGEKKKEARHLKAATKTDGQHYNKDEKLGKRRKLLEMFKISSYLALLFSVYSSKHILQSQQYTSIVAALQEGGMDKNRAALNGSLSVSLTTVVNMILTRGLDLSVVFSSQSDSGHSNVLKLLVAHCASLIGVAYSRSTRLYPLYMAANSVTTTLLQQHLGAYAPRNNPDETSISGKVFQNLQSIVIPLASLLMPTVLSYVFTLFEKSSHKSLLGGDALRFKFSVLFVSQMIVTTLFLL
ncbi:ribosomal protein L20 [Acrasis kona]|uniref:Ribosomal protein L20 n=1 Tax=Acrasis kona TaxID=1008807 RepID=A0AAW2Z1T7_9EUKA